MGKKTRVPGVNTRPEKGKKQRQEIATRALLLGATWDKYAGLLIREQRGEAGGLPTVWAEYFDVNGVPVGPVEASKRIKEAEKRYRLGRHAQPLRPSFSKSIINDAIRRQREKSNEFHKMSTHASDALRYAIDNGSMDTIKFVNLRGNT